MNRSYRMFFAAIVLVFTSSAAFAQVSTGVPPFSSISRGPEAVNNANLNAHWDIPFRSRLGRGTNFTYDMSYDTSVWYPVGVSGSQTWTPVYNWGWRAVTETVTGYVDYTTQHGSCYDSDLRRTFSYTLTTYNYYHDAFGVAHSLGPTTVVVPANTPCPVFYPGTKTIYLQDGSGSKVVINQLNVNVFAVDGKNITPPVGQGTGSANFIDRNGNEITTDGNGNFYDTLSSTIAALTVAGSGTPTSPKTFTYNAPSGGSAVYTMKYTTYSIMTNFGCSGILDYGTNGTTTANLVTPE